MHFGHGSGEKSQSPDGLKNKIIDNNKVTENFSQPQLMKSFVLGFSGPHVHKLPH